MGMQKKYYKEISDFVKEKTGCDEVVCFHHQVRNEDKKGKEGIDGYVSSFPHTDSSSVSADGDALAMLPSGKSSDYQRYLYMNLWRNISDSPIENDNLAMLDERTTVKPDDYIVKDLFGEGYTVVQYGLNARHADNHKWYYFPEMKRDEAILFKQADSDWTKKGRICFHTSVNDLKIKKYRTRESIETRMICYWKNAESGVDSMPNEENTNAALIKDSLEVAEAMSSTYSNPFNFLKQVYNYIFSTNGTSNYSGKPEDYLERFVNAVYAISDWPSVGKSWARGIMLQESIPEKGISKITKELVKDSYNYSKTKEFKKEEQQEIADFLLSNEKYMQTAKKSFEGLLKD